MGRATFSSGVVAQKKKSGHIKNLPDDILLDIISRLPVESVLKCKLICKGWWKLLHGRKSFFTNMHLTRQLNQLYSGGAADADKVDTGLLFSCNTDDTSQVSLFYGGLYNNKINTDDTYAYKKTLKKVRHPPLHLKWPGQYLVNSCNGLVCLSRHHSQGIIDPTYIYNPATGEYVNLPKFIIPRGDNYPYIARGFGYIPSTNEYKVVRIYYRYSEAIGLCQVYTLGTGCGWRTKCIPFPWVNFEPPAAFVGGSLYWFLFLNIYEFDLAKEELRMVPSPPIHTLDLGSFVRDDFGLVVLRGNLCFFNQTLNAPHMEIWSLKKTAMNESWCKVFSIKKEPGSDDYFWPIIMTENNKIIFMKSYETLVCYDPESTTWKEIVVADSQFSLGSISVISHVNTFVSLRSLGQKASKRSCRNKMIKKSFSNQME